MRTAVQVLASMTLGLLLASGAALLNAVKPAEATFPGQSSNTVKFMVKFIRRGVSEERGLLLSSRYARVSYRPSALGFCRLSTVARFGQQTTKERP
jgi:hypothetical protein